MSITSTLTTIGAAGAGGSLSYWALEFSLANSSSNYHNKIDYNDDIVAITYTNTNSSSDRGGNILVFNQDGTLKNNKLIKTSQNSYAGSFYPLDIHWDEDTNAWYTHWYYSGYNYIGRHSGDPDGGFSWLKRLGITGGMTETGNIYSLDASSIVVHGATSTPANAKWKLSKSNGATQAFKRYTSSGIQSSSRSARVNPSSNNTYITNTRSYSSKTTGIVGCFSSKDVVNINGNGAFYYSVPNFDGESGPTPIYVSAVDGNGNCISVVGQRLVSTNASGAKVWIRNTNLDTPLAFCYAPQGGYLLMLTKDCEIVRINNSGYIADGVKRKVNFPRDTPDWQEADMQIDEDNNVVYICTRGSGQGRVIIKRPLDSSLDGTYGSYTLSTSSAAQFTDHTANGFTGGIERGSQSWGSADVADNAVSESSSHSNDYRFTITKEDIG